MNKKPFYKRKRFILICSILLIFILLRLILPTLAKNYVNKSLSSLPGYYGHVDDICISLFRGAYNIEDMYIDKIDGASQVPFITIKQMEISVQWKSLFHGRIVSEIALNTPELIYVFEDQELDDDTKLEDWTKVLTDLVPISINRLEITNGKIAFVQIIPDPTIDVHIHSIKATAINLQNVRDKSTKLPSSFNMEGISIGNGRLQSEGKLNLLKVIPDMDIALSLEDVDITSINNLMNEYAKIDFESGILNIYSEVALADGYLKSYIKPLLKDSKLIGSEDGILETLWEGFVGFF